MSTFSRRLRRWELPRLAAALIAVAWLGVLAAYGYAALTVTPDVESVLATAALVAIAGAGTLYAWRELGR